VSIGLFLFFALGYVMSDALFFKQLVRENNIHTAEDAWNFLESRASTKDSAITAGLSARYMLTAKRRLSCDEGALLMATILRETDYSTSLVDLYGADSIPLHTVLEVKDRNGLPTFYDTYCHFHHSTLERSAECCNFKLKKSVRRPSWSLHRSMVYYNAFFKFIVFKMRGIPG
jgi:hypothetical protein